MNDDRMDLIDMFPAKYDYASDTHICFPEIQLRRQNSNNKKRNKTMDKPSSN